MDKGESMTEKFNPGDYREIRKRVKIIIGKDAEDTDRQAASFEKSHTIIEVIQNSPNVMVIFYVDKHGEK